MKLTVCRVALLCLAFLLLQTQTNFAAAQPSPPASKIGYVKNRGEFDGCGCSLWRATERKQSDARLVFVSDEGEAALMNLDGKDVKLAHVRHYERQAMAKVGARSWWEYQKGDTKVRVDLVVRRVCPPKDESCEVTHYTAQITVTRGPQKQMVNAKGMCGC